jgi:peptidoglycan/LPS O-acetylase OafA/YrhL
VNLGVAGSSPVARPILSRRTSAPSIVNRHHVSFQRFDYPPQRSGRAMKSHVPELDGLRGAACLLVLSGHFLASGAAPTMLPVLGHVFSQFWSGVDLFFVLSGFVIFHSLHRQQESEPSRALLMKSFIAHRFFRVMPVYLLLVLSYFLIPVFRPSLALVTPFVTSIPKWCYPCFGQVYWGVNHHRAGADYMNVTWSLCAEVQFYVAAAVLVLAFRPRTRIAALTTLVVVAYLARVYCVFRANDQAAAYLLPVCRMDGFMMGGIAATLYATQALPLQDTRLLDVVLVPLTIVYGYLAYAEHLQSEIFSIFFSYTFYSLFYCLVVVRVLSGRWTYLAAGPIAAFGTISYFVYLFQVPALSWVEATVQGAWARLAALLFLLIGAGIVSWYGFERPLIRWGRSFAARKRCA